MQEILASLDPISWTESRRILKGEPFSFENRNYLFQPYRDEFHQIFFMKGRQVEMSEFSINWLLNKLNRHPYTNGLHAFPRSAQAQRFAKMRLEYAIKESDILAEWYENNGSDLTLKKFMQKDNPKQPYNYYILGGTWESRKDTVGDAARGMSLDFAVYDERQDHPNDVETVLGEALSHSKYKQTITLGTPKLPGIQFDQQWESSDKRYWFVKCPHCGRENPITMDNILDSGDEKVGYYYGCPNCKNPIDRNIGRWMSTIPRVNPEYHGYHINQLMVSWLTANEIMRKKTSTTYPRRRFHNEVLGESYGGDDVPITLAMLEECGENEYRLGDLGEFDTIYAGIDWGAKSYLYIQNKQHRLVDCEIAGDSDPRQHPIKLARYIAKYGKRVKKVVCDAGPDITRYYSLKEELAKIGIKCNVYACYYSTPPAKTDIVWDEDKLIVTVGRSEVIEVLIDEIHDHKLVLPGYDLGIEKVDLLLDHFQNIAAEKVENKSGNQFIIYVATGPDHFLHAKVYSDIACGGIVIDSIGKSAPPINAQHSIDKNNKFERDNKHKGKFPSFSMSKKVKTGRR